MNARVSTQGLSVRRLTIRYIIGLTLVAVIAVIAFTVLRQQIFAEQDTAAVINISGRQRMLSQKAAFLSLRLAEPADAGERAVLRRELADTVRLMNESHQALIHGNKALGVSGGVSREVLALFHDQPVALEAKLHSYMDELTSLVAAPDSELSRQNQHVINVVERSDEVLDALDMVVNRLQEESRDRINRFRFLQAYLLATTLAVLLLQGMFIFKPAVTLIKKEADGLAAANLELQRLSDADGLTGIANRRLLDEFLEREWSRSARQVTPLTLIMADIDFFKNYNDTYGHHAGDECLKRVAATLEAGVKRASDLVARYGGEEFAVVLPDTGLAGGAAVAEKLRSDVEKLQIEHRESPLMKVVTISLGVATIIPVPGLLPDELIVLADQALYQAKQQGRNRVAAGDYSSTAMANSE